MCKGKNNKLLHECFTKHLLDSRVYGCMPYDAGGANILFMGYKKTVKISKTPYVPARDSHALASKKT